MLTFCAFLSYNFKQTTSTSRVLNNRPFRAIGTKTTGHTVPTCLPIHHFGMIVPKTACHAESREAWTGGAEPASVFPVAFLLTHSTFSPGLGILASGWESPYGLGVILRQTNIVIIVANGREVTLGVGGALGQTDIVTAGTLAMTVQLHC